jgi:hypothetical protein
MLYEAQLMMASNFERWKASLAFSQNQESAFLVLGLIISLHSTEP